MKWRFEDARQVKRHKQGEDLQIPEYDVASKKPESPCGKVKITGKVDEQGTDIEFEFTPSQPLPEGCCEQYGWIQHVTAGAWRYDNGTRGGRFGAPSQPDKSPQGQNSGERWDPNPWYGGPGNVTDDRRQRIRDTLDGEEEAEALDNFEQEWPEKPSPQTEIRDHPGGNPLGFVTQLVCVETGKVVFQYRWLQYKPRGETKWKFVGSEGKNMSITP